MHTRIALLVQHDTWLFVAGSQSLFARAELPNLDHLIVLHLDEHPIPLLARWRYEATILISIDAFEGENLKNLKELLDSRGFGVASVSSKFAKYKHDSWEDDEDWSEHKGVLERCLEVAGELHASYTRTFAFNRIEGSSLEDCLPIIVERLGWAADAAASREDLPTLGYPIMPTSAISFNSSIISYSSPASPLWAILGA